VAYYLLTGERVFGKANRIKVLMQHVQEEPIPPSHRTELEIPREVDELVLACLRKDPKLRPASADELLRMATTCRITDVWDQEAARNWWELHLPNLVMPRKVSASAWNLGERRGPAEKARVLRMQGESKERK
jgi:serine/threonine protein kinase